MLKPNEGYYEVQPEEEEEKAIIVLGNLSDGFQFIGPFDTFDEASAYADNKFYDYVTWIASLREIIKLKH